MPEDEAAGLPVPPPLVLYGRYASPFVRRVAVTLRLYGVDYRHVPLMPFGPDKAELAKFNPIARVPALRLDNGEIWSTARSSSTTSTGWPGRERR